MSVALLTLLAHSGANACLPEPGGLVAMALVAGFLEVLVRALRRDRKSAPLALALLLPALLLGQFVGHVVMAHGVLAGVQHHGGVLVDSGRVATKSGNPFAGHIVSFTEPKMLTFHLGAAIVAALLLLHSEQILARWRCFTRALLNPILLPPIPIFRQARIALDRPCASTPVDAWSPLRSRAPPLFI